MNRVRILIKSFWQAIGDTVDQIRRMDSRYYLIAIALTAAANIINLTGVLK